MPDQSWCAPATSGCTLTQGGSLANPKMLGKCKFWAKWVTSEYDAAEAMGGRGKMAARDEVSSWSRAARFAVGEKAAKGGGSVKTATEGVMALVRPS
jgi:hypothetical protein